MYDQDPRTTHLAGNSTSIIQHLGPEINIETGAQLTTRLPTHDSRV